MLVVYVFVLSWHAEVESNVFSITVLNYNFKLLQYFVLLSTLLSVTGKCDFLSNLIIYAHALKSFIKEKRSEFTSM